LDLSSSAAFRPDVSKWDAWHPAEVADRLAGVDVPWAVIAGWSLDLFLGRQTREHEDLEIAIPAHALPAILDAIADFEHFAVGDGYARPLTAKSLEDTHQTWIRERETGIWRLDVIREPWDGDTWICRRDPRIRRPGSEVVTRTADGIPYQQPEIALLFKAKHTRDKDERDFTAVLALLGRSRRAWLADALALVHPGHPWLEALASPRG
jgi:hypothetical protein